jgi:hypothetical protein
MGFAVVAGIPPAQMAQSLAEQPELPVPAEPKAKRKTEPAASKAPADGMG